MTKEKIIQMLRASCDKDKVDPEHNGFWVIHTEELETFAKLVAEKAIEEALAQPEQEPVAWMDKDGDVLSASIVDGKGLRNIPLYTTPSQTWVGLTDEEVKDIVWNLPYEPSQEHIRAIEAKLKEKNT